MGVSKAETAIHDLEENISTNSNLDQIPALLTIIDETCTNVCQEIKEHMDSNALF